MLTKSGMKSKYDRLFANGIMHLAKGEPSLAEKYLSEAAVQWKEYISGMRDEERVETREWFLELCGHIKEIQRYNAMCREDEENGEAVRENESESFLFTCADIPSVSFDDVVGLESVKRQIYDMVIYPRQYKELYEKFRKKSGGGILLYGPPGNGKTMIAKAIAHETGSAFYPIKFSDLGSKWFGETENRIKSLFDEARKAESAVIFFDEIDAIAPNRTDSSTMDRVVAELLTQIDGINKGGGNLTILAATNKPQSLDPAIMRPGRFDEKIYIPLPDAEARRAMFRSKLCDIPTLVNNYSEIAELSEGFSGAEIELVCEKAKQSVIRRIISGAPESTCIANNDIYEAIAQVRAS